jgi:hypothetical protein
MDTVSAGRPSDYTPELLAKAYAYINGGYEIAGDVVPTIAGMSCELGVTRETCHAWGRDESKPEFSHILTRVMQLQERKLVNGGLKGDFNPAITKMMMTKHDYSDSTKQEITGAGGEALALAINFVSPK